MKPSSLGRILVVATILSLVLGFWGGGAEAASVSVQPVTLVYGGLYPSGSTITAPINSPVISVLPVSSSAPFLTGMVIQIDNELMQITAVSSGQISVTRGYGGSTIANHLTGASIADGVVTVPISVSGVTSRSVGTLATQLDSNLFEASGASLTQTVGSGDTTMTISDPRQVFVGQIVKTTDAAAEQMLVLGTRLGYQQPSTVLTAAVGTSDTVIPIADSSLLQVGWLALVDSEFMTIDALTPTSMTVTRGVNGSAAASHGAGIPVFVARTTLSSGVTIYEESVPVASIAPLSVGMFVLVGQEYMQIKSLIASPPTMVVTRGIPGSLGVLPHTSGDTVQTGRTFLVSNAFGSAATLSSSISSGQTSGIAVSDTSQLQVSEVLSAESELMQISAIGAGTIDVTRGFSGTTAAAHASGVALPNAVLQVQDATQVAVSDTVQIDAEQMTVNARDTGGSPNTLTVIRARNGTVLDAHAAGTILFAPGTTLSANVGTFLTTIPMASVASLQAGWFALVDQEVMQITAVNASPPSISVVRGAPGVGGGLTVPAAHAAGAPVYTGPDFMTVVRGVNGTTAAPHSPQPLNENLRTITVSPGLQFTSGSLLQIQLEQLRVVTEDSPTSTARVTRGEGGTLASLHGAGSTITDVDGAGGADAIVTFPSALLQPIGYTDGAFLTSTGRSDICQPMVVGSGSAALNCQTFGLTPAGPTGGGTLFGLQVLPTGTTGLTSATIGFSTASVADTSGDSFGVTFSNLQRGIFLCGDVTADFRVNGSDVFLMKAHGGQSASGGNAIFDLRPDGFINGSDLLIMKLQGGIRCYHP